MCIWRCQLGCQLKRTMDNIQVDDKVVGRPWRRSNEDDDGNEPVEEQLHRSAFHNFPTGTLPLTEAAGVLNGLLDAQNLLQGKIPSLANS